MSIYSFSKAAPPFKRWAKKRLSIMVASPRFESWDFGAKINKI
jgi:hypothetical protein